MLHKIYHNAQAILQGYYKLMFQANASKMPSLWEPKYKSIMFVNVTKLLEAPKELLNENIFTSFKTTLAFTNSQTHLMHNLNIVCKIIISSSTQQNK